MPSFMSAQVFRISALRQGADLDVQALSQNSRIIWAMIAAMLVASIVGYLVSGLSFAWWGFATMGKCTGLFLAISFLYRRVRPDPWIGFGAEGCGQLLLVLTLGTVLSFILATAGFPYSDALLNDADKWMGLDWRAYLHLVNERPFLRDLTSFAYGSLAIQAIVLIFILVVTSRLSRLQQYIIANAIGLTVTLAIFTFMPAGGTFAFLKIQPSEFANLSPVTTSDQLVQLDLLRSAPHSIIRELGGIISFPSFHTVLAVFLMWAFFPIRLLRFPAIVLNLLVIVGTPIFGAHYFIDIFGGMIVAVVSIYAATFLTRAAAKQEVFGTGCRVPARP